MVDGSDACLGRRTTRHARKHAHARDTHTSHHSSVQPLRLLVRTSCSARASDAVPHSVIVLLATCDAQLEGWYKGADSNGNGITCQTTCTNVTARAPRSRAPRWSVYSSAIGVGWFATLRRAACNMRSCAPPTHARGRPARSTNDIPHFVSRPPRRFHRIASPVGTFHEALPRVSQGPHSSTSLLHGLRPFFAVVHLHRI